MLEKEIEKFKKYVNNYNMEDENILRKYMHSFRVMDYSIEIAKSINLDDKKIEVCALIGLLHDIGRFEQYKRYGTYSDIKSIDHAELGVQILNNNNYIDEYEKDNDKKKIIIDAIYNHNKFAIDEKINNESLLYAKIIRDADKIDIMDKQGNENIPDGILCKEEYIKNIYLKKLCVNSSTENKADIIVKMICFIYDFNFSYTYEFVKQKGIITKKLNLLENHLPNNLKIIEIEKVINEYLTQNDNNIIN